MHARKNEIIARARQYEGRRYRHQGRSWETGVDCAGLLICVAKDLGISGFDTTQYGRRPQPREFDKAMREAGCTLVPFAQKQPGDILRIAERNWPVHSAILDMDKQGVLWLIHAYLPAKKVVRERLTPQKALQVKMVWRFPEA